MNRLYADSQSFYDNAQDYDRAFDEDWGRVNDKRFQKFLGKEAFVTTDAELVSNMHVSISMPISHPRRFTLFTVAGVQDCNTK